MILPNIVYNYRVSDTGLTKKKHTYDEFLLLSHAYQESLIYYTDKRLQEYMILQIIRNYLNAIKRILYSFRILLLNTLFHVKPK